MKNESAPTTSSPSFLEPKSEILEVYITQHSGIRLFVRDSRGVTSWQNEILRDCVDRDALTKLLETSYKTQLEQDKLAQIEAEQRQKQLEEEAALALETQRVEAEKAAEQQRLEFESRVQAEVQMRLEAQK